METLKELFHSIEQRMPGRPHEAMPLAERLLARAREEQQPLYEARALRALAAGLGYLGRFEEAVAAAERALEISQQLDDDALLLRCVITRGALYLAEGRHQPAGELYRRYLPRSERPELLSERGKLLNNLGVIARRQGDYPVALKYFLECLDIDRRLGTLAGQALTLHNLAEVYLWLEIHDQAEAHAREGLSILDRYQEEHGRGYLLNDLGVVELARGNAEQARQLHVEAGQMAQEQQDLGVWAYSQMLEAACLDDADERGLELLQAAVQLTRECGDRHLCAGGLLRLGDRLLRMDRLDEARECLEEAEALSRETGSEELLCTAGESLARLHAASGDHERAYRLLQDNLKLRDRIKGARAAQRIQAVTAPWELRALEAEKELLRLRNAELESLSRHDFLTGLANRRFLQQRLSELWSEGPLALLVLDLDFFKRINDRHSHDIGDQVLQETAELMRVACPGNGLAARYGGEEFVMLLPGATLDQAVQLAERLRESFASHDWNSLVPGLPVTISIGVAHSDEVATDSALLRLADTRLYQAKRSGRNRVSSVVDQSFS